MFHFHLVGIIIWKSVITRYTLICIYEKKSYKCSTSFLNLSNPLRYSYPHIKTMNTFFALILILKRRIVFSFIEYISALYTTILTTPTTSLWCQPPPIWSGCWCKRPMLSLNFRTVRRWNNFVSARLGSTLIPFYVYPVSGEGGTFHL